MIAFSQTTDSYNVYHSHLATSANSKKKMTVPGNKHVDEVPYKGRDYNENVKNAPASAQDPENIQHCRGTIIIPPVNYKDNRIIITLR